MFGQHWRVLVTALIPYVVMVGLLYVAYAAAFLPVWLDGIRGEPQSTQEVDDLFAVFAIIYLAIVVVSLLASVLVRNLVAAAVLIADGGAPTVRSMLSVRRAGRTIGLALLTALIVLVGFVLCIVPGLIAAVLLCFAVPAMVDEDLGAVAAIRRSGQISRQHFWPSALMTLMVGLVASVGGYACLVGIVVSAPVAVLMQVHGYRSLTGRPISISPA